jgi:SAM-dependent methyltransferase
MKPDEIAKSYDQIADHWDSDEFPRSDGIEHHERAIAFVKERRNAIDIGCGSSGRFIDQLIGHGFNVEGLDISGRMIELAKKRHPDIQFHHADIRDWTFSKTYDLISAWDSIWHLPLKNQDAVMTKILRALAKGGAFIFTTGGLDAPEEKTDSAMGPRMYYSVLGIPRILKLISDNQCVCRHLEYDQYPELHLSVIVQRL